METVNKISMVIWTCMSELSELKQTTRNCNFYAQAFLNITDNDDDSHDTDTPT